MKYINKYDWECFTQTGGNGIVINSSKGTTYQTAFFEAFPKTPSCFIRGEGKTIEDAEKQAWNKYQKILVCDHEMERRDRTDGYGYCKHCSYSAMVFEPLTKCCKCNKPTNFTSDYKGNHYCKKHARFLLKDPSEPIDEIQSKLPRKIKKALKKALIIFTKNKGNDYEWKLKNKYYFFGGPCYISKCSERQISFFTKSQVRNFIKENKKIL